MEQQQDEICCICFDGSVYDHNEIVFCDACGMGVHQDCYNVSSIPKGEWFCRPCTLNLDAQTIRCILCPFPGGAFNPVRRPIPISLRSKVNHKSAWCHVVCATWVPDVSIAQDGTVHLDAMDPVRANLKCIMCGERGVSIQCAHLSCCRAFHPWCALRAEQGAVACGIGKVGPLETYCRIHLAKHTQSDFIFINDASTSREKFKQHLKQTKKPVARSFTPSSKHRAPPRHATLKAPKPRRSTAMQRKSRELVVVKVNDTVDERRDDRETVESDEEEEDDVAVSRDECAQAMWNRTSKEYFPYAIDSKSLDRVLVRTIGATTTSDIVDRKTEVARVENGRVTIVSESITNPRDFFPYFDVTCAAETQLNDRPNLLCVVFDTGNRSVRTSYQVADETIDLVEIEPVSIASNDKVKPPLDEINLEMVKVTQQLEHVQCRSLQRLLWLMDRPIPQEIDIGAEEHHQYMGLRNCRLATGSLKRGIADRRQVVLKDHDDDDDGTCVVCFDGSSDENNSIVFCDSCNIALHQACYGVFPIPEGDFFCDRCLHEETATTRTCTLCTVTTGAFKRTTCGRWVHVFCALWCPDVKFRDLTTFSPIDTVPAIESRHKGNVCSVCTVVSGWTTTCAHAGCTVTMHPLCGWRDGMYARCNAMQDFDMYCSQHTPSEGEEDRAGQAKWRIEVSNCIRLNKKVRRTPKTRAVVIMADIYRSDQCAACFERCKDADVHCDTCTVPVHEQCVPPDWTCQSNLKCCLCPRLGGFIVRILDTELYAHQYCISNCIALTQPNAITQLRTLNHTKKDMPCSFCEKQEGNLMQCSVKQCAQTVHPLCCVFEHGYFDTKGTWFCAKHTPKDKVYDPYRCQWISVSDILFLRALRVSLERTRTLIELCRRHCKRRKRVIESEHCIFEATASMLPLRTAAPSELCQVYKSLTGSEWTAYPTKTQVQMMFNKGGRLKRSVATYVEQLPLAKKRKTPHHVPTPTRSIHTRLFQPEGEDLSAEDYVFFLLDSMSRLKHVSLERIMDQAF